MSKTFIIVIQFIIILILIATILSIMGGNKTNQNTTPAKIETLKMGLIPADDAESMLRDYEPVQEYLSERLGISVEIQVTSDYASAIEAMRAKHIDMAWFGPFSYIIAHNIAGAEAIVNGVRRSDGKAEYHSVIIANVNSGIKTLEDLRGKTFAFVDPSSTSGNLIPRNVLIENGIDPDNDFKTSYYAGTHNAVQYAIANGTSDAGASSDNVYNRMVEAGEIDPEVSKIIFTSDPVPGSPIALRNDLPQEIKDAIKDALLTMDEQTLHQVDGWGDIARYQEVSDSDYDIIRQTAINLGMDVSSPESANK